MTIYEEALQLTARMTLGDKVRLLEHLSHALRDEMASANDEKQT